MLNVGGAELLIILLVALVFLGPERLPTVARQIGQSVSSLRSMANGFQAEFEAAAREGSAAADAGMSLDGPTSKADAIKATQTDPSAIAAAARQVRYDDEIEAEKIFGGPTDLRDLDEAEQVSGGLTDVWTKPSRFLAKPSRSLVG